MKVILCVGPSSAGKSTFCNELSVNHQWVTVSGDDEMDKLMSSNEQLILKKLKDQGLIDDLRQYMNEKEVLKLCLGGRLNISLGDHRVTNFQFSSPDYDGLDDVLKKAGFDDIEKNKLALIIKKVGQVYKDNQKLFPDPLVSTLEEAFKLRDNPNATVIIDIVPNIGDNPKTLLDKFHSRAEQFRTEHADVPLEIFTVLAYTSPKDLSERITQRNIEADQKGNLKNKREGTFPFHQLGTLLTKSKDEKKQLGETSKDELLTIAYKHQWRHPKDQNKGKFKKVANAALESVRLSKTFGVWADSTNKMSLGAREDLLFDAMIDTTKGKPTPQVLATRLIQSIEEVSRNRKSKSSTPTSNV